jgi:hypothetical protein
VLEHPAWLAAVEGDKSLLRAHSDIVFKALKQEKAMGFWPIQDVIEDQLRVLCVYYLNDNSGANGNYSDACLLLAQPNSAEGAERKK